MRRESDVIVRTVLSGLRGFLNALQDLNWAIVIGYFPIHATRSTCKRLMLQAIVTSDQSQRALSIPRMRI